MNNKFAALEFLAVLVFLSLASETRAATDARTVPAPSATRATDTSAELSPDEVNAVVWLEDKAAEEKIEFLRGDGSRGLSLKEKNLVSGIMSRDEMHLFLDELQYQLTYAKDACNSSKDCGKGDELLKDASEYVVMMGSHPYLLPVNVGFSDTLQRVHVLMLLCANEDKNSFYPIFSRLTPLVDKEENHLSGLSKIYEAFEDDRIQERMGMPDYEAEKRKTK